MNALFTEKQLKIMDAIFKGNDEGGFLDLEQLRDRLDYAPKKQALQCSLKFLERHGLVERELVTRRNRLRRLVKPTPLAFQTLRSVPRTLKEGSGTEDLEIEV